LRARGPGALALLAAGAALSPACRRQPPVATVLETAGTVERGEANGWRAAPTGTTFDVGDVLRTGPAARARLGLAGGGAIRVGENARLRFRRGAVAGQQAPDIAIDLGAAELEETVSDLSIITAVGPARVERGAHVRVVADGETASLEVVVGRAVMLEAGREVPIDAGQGVRIHVGSAEIQRFALKVGTAIVEEKPPAPDAGAAAQADARAAAQADAEASPQPEARAAPPAEARAAPPPAEAAADAGARGARREASHADITITAGESATLHDARPSVAVRLPVAALCSGEAVVEVGGRHHRQERFAGTGSVVVHLRPGARRYRVRCADDGDRAAPRAAGELTLRKDTGYVPLARRPPSDVIDADGRRYTVLFQTRLPQLTLAWPGAPGGAAHLDLHVQSPAGDRVVAAVSPRRPLPSGVLKEGTFVLWYEAAGGKQSPKTTVSLRFDNAAPTAQFFRTSGAAKAGPRGAITVDGVTVDGTKVSAGGQPLPVDAQGRFHAALTPLDGDDAVAVRLEHPRTGVHYYVRRRGRGAERAE
jgi:hypothetical protein